MSKLFREMHEANSPEAERPSNATVMTELLTAVQVEDEAAREATASPLLKCESVDLPPMKRPILMNSDENSGTQSAFESYRSLRTKITRLQSSQGIKSVAISSAVSGEGKTISAVNLGICLAQLDSQRVLIVDADIRTAGMSELMGIADRPGLSEVLNKKCDFYKAVLSTSIPRLYMVGAGSPPCSAADLFANSQWKEFIAQCNETFDMVVIDCPPILGLSDFDLISAGSDGVMLVVRAHKTKRETLTEINKHLQGKKVLGVLLNGQEKRQSNYYGYHYYARNRVSA